MKIVHVINSLATGGAENLVVNLAAQANSTGHQSRILVFKDSHGIPRTRALELGIDVKVLGKSIRDPRLLYRLRNATEDADIVHVHLFPALYWSLFVKVPKIFTEHSTHNRRVGKIAFRITEYFAYEQFEKIVAISEGVAESVKLHLEKIKSNTAVEVVPNGIPGDFFEIERKYRLEPTRIISIGSLKSIKRHHLALEAVALLENVSLRIAGDGPLKGELQESIDDLEIGERVELLGNVEDIPGLLADSDLLLSTSLYEGFGLAAAEAQAAGIPVVGPNVSGFREVVINGETGILFEQDDPQSIAHAVAKALDEENYQRLVRNARRMTQKYTIENCFGHLLQIYKAVLSAK